MRSKSVGNLVRSFTPPKTKWCTKIEYDHILVPADVDESLERFDTLREKDKRQGSTCSLAFRLYERILSEHVTSWYSDLSPDEEFIQELRHVLRDVTSDLVSRLARLDITEFLLKDLTQTAVQHLDCYLWARHHRQADTPQALLSSWAAFVGEAQHPALTDREAETLHLHNIAQRILPLVVKVTELFTMK